MSREAVEKFVTGMLEDRRINMVMVPDAIEAALYRNVFCVFLGVVEQVIQDMSFTVVDLVERFDIEPFSVFSAK